MRKNEIRAILRKKFEAYRDEVIAEIIALPPECRQSGDDSVLENVWEEFKYQAQGEESYYFDAYVQTIEAICRKVLSRLPPHELELLWIETDAYFNHDEEDPLPDRDELLEAIEQELYNQVFNQAEREDLKVDPDEDREIEEQTDDEEA